MIIMKDELNSIQFNSISTRHLLCCSFPVPLSRADMFMIPLASISKVTSICGTPLGAGGIPTLETEEDQ